MDILNLKRQDGVLPSIITFGFDLIEMEKTLKLNTQTSLPTV